MPSSNPQSRAPEFFTPNPTSEQVLEILKKSSSPRFFYSVSACPSFFVLFPDEKVVPRITTPDGSDMNKDELNRLFKLVSVAAKKVLRQKKTSCSRLPQEFYSHMTTLIRLSAAKSQTSKPKAKAQAKDKESQPATPTKSKGPKPADILKCLKESTTPRFYFEQTPTFQNLFPGTTMPRFTRRSGNVYIEREAFQPLLLSRIRSAKKYLLTKHKISVTKVPDSFLRDQTRLITASVQAKISEKANERKQKRTTPVALPAPSTAQAQSSASISFVPSQDSTVQQPDAVVPTTSQDPEAPAPDSPEYLRKVRPLLRTMVPILRGNSTPPRELTQALHKALKPTGLLKPEALKSLNRLHVPIRNVEDTTSHFSGTHPFYLIGTSPLALTPTSLPLFAPFFSNILDQINALTALDYAHSLREFS